MHSSSLRSLDYSFSRLAVSQESLASINPDCESYTMVGLDKKVSRFGVYSGSTIIGYSELEGGDPPMGCAGGRFLPLPNYSSVKASCRIDPRSENVSQEHLALSVRLVGGDAIPAQGGVLILDYSDEPDIGAIEVHVQGIPYPLYEELFPDHVAKYKRQFS